MDIFDFHTHPYYENEENLCIYKNDFSNARQDSLNDMRKCCIKGFAGSIINKKGTGFEPILSSNESAFKLCRIYAGEYFPGIQIHPDYIEESIAEINKTKERGFNLIGELVPYTYGWDYSAPGFEEILNYTDGKGFVFSLHSTDIEKMGEIAARHKDTNFVFAHPGEADRLKQHIEVMKKCDNVFLDLSGTGLFRYGMLRHLVNEVSAEKIIFGTDYPICNPAMYVGGVLYEKIQESDMEKILSKNAKRLLSIKE